MAKRLIYLLVLSACLLALIHRVPAQTNAAPSLIVLHAARLLDVETGRMLTPGEVRVEGERIAEIGSAVAHPAGAQVIDLGDTTLLPGLIDSHVHLFLHPGAEDLQTVQESVPQRAIMATLAARADLMAGYTAERDMGTEGAGSADTAVRNAINQGLIPVRGFASVATPSPLLAATKTPSATTPSSACSQTPPMPIIPPN